MKLVSCPVGSLGFDTDWKLDTTHLPFPLIVQAFDFVIRYLSLGGMSGYDLGKARVGSLHDIDRRELVTILDAGKGVMFVQHAHAEGWKPTPILGGQDAAAAIAHAQFLALPPNTILWLDLEGCAADTHEDAAFLYADAWSADVLRAGYRPGVYVGAGCAMSGAALYRLPHVKNYWQSQSLVPTPAPRGYQMIQLYPTTMVAGLSVDIDITQLDYRGDAPTMLVGSSSPFFAL